MEFWRNLPNKANTRMRVFIGILIVSILFFSCAEKKKEASNFLQKGKIKLAKPRVTVPNTMIDSFVSLTPEIHMDKLSIGYEASEKTPTETSIKLHTSIYVTKAGVHTFRAFHPNWKSSDVTSIKLYKKGFIPNKIKWLTSASDQYRGQGELTLINNEKASLLFRNTQWIGFDPIEKASVSFPQRTYIESLTIGYLIDPKSWIFPPKKVTLYFNDKDSIYIDNSVLTEKEIVKLDDIKIPINKELKTLIIKVTNVQKLPDWHAGKGNKAWLFMDEWIFN